MSKSIALAKLLGLTDFEESDPSIPVDTTIAEQVARGKAQIQQLRVEHALSDASVEFANDLLDFLAAQSEKRGLSGKQFSTLFGVAADLHQTFDFRLNANVANGVTS